MDIPPQLKKSKCDIDYCPGLAEMASFLWEVCEAAIHLTCFSAILGSSLNTLLVAVMRFSVRLCVALGMEGIRKECMALGSMKKKQLVQLASSAQVQVTHRIDGKSRQVTSQPMMVRRSIAKKMVGLNRQAVSLLQSVEIRQRQRQI